MGTWAFLIALLVALLILRFLGQLWSQRHFPPGPLSLPVIGGLWRIVTMLNENILIELAKQYGNICTLWLGHLPLVLLSGYEAVKEGVIDHAEKLSDRPSTPFYTSLGKGRGIALSNGHTWKQQRRFAVVTMRKLGLGKKGMEHQIEEEAQQLVEIFACAKGQPLDPSLPITNAVANVICAVTFGHRYSLEDEKFQKLIEAVNSAIKFVGGIFHVLYEMFPSILKHLPGPHKKVITVSHLVLSYAKEEIKKHKEQLSFHEPQDFMDFYLLQMEKNKNDPNSTFDEENLAYSIQDFFVAGTESTATTLRWALVLLTNHPDIQDKVHKEIEDVFASSQSISYQDLKKVPYTNAVIHEIQRSNYAFFFGAPRQCSEDVKLGGFLLPKGTLVIPDLRSVLLDPKQWETPKEFNPNHFLDKDGNFVTRKEFLPFGAGTRVCLAEQLARIELFIFLIKLLRAFRFQLPEGVKKLSQDPVMGLTFQPPPYKICAVPHSSSS
ncbi:cytochrome P450 2J5-like [Elgaria multicarinata webbii]|uniref:cytochrome P450 2J5-like n=1 Tax=Elgaria multicarinata webbii TaxID=159646 RepID=UPI002FCD5260